MGRPIQLFIVLAGMCLLGPAGEAADPCREMLASMQALENGRNYREAADLGRRLLLRRDCPAECLEAGLVSMADCLDRLNRYGEIDGIYEEVLDSHGESWRLYWRLGRAYRQLRKHGRVTAGEFRRGRSRGAGGRWVDAAGHDRRQVLLWFEKARRLLAGKESGVPPGDLDSFYRDYGDCLSPGGPSEAWRRWLATDLESVPSWEDEPAEPDCGTGAPVDDRGDPLFQPVPAAFEKAANDGERRLFLMRLRLRLGREFVPRVLREQAEDSRRLYGTRTLRRRPQWANPQETPWRAPELEGLKDNETVARLAGGVRRFVLPDRYAYILLFRRLAEEFREPEACADLSEIHLDRRQPEQALRWCREGLRILEESGRKDESLRVLLSGRERQLTGNFCEIRPFEDILPARRESRATVEFRNAERVRFSLERADVPALLESLRAEILDGRRRDLRIGAELPLGRWFAEKSPFRRHLRPYGQAWTARLPERIPYRTRRTELPLPGLPSGIYVLTARTEGGGVSRMPLISSEQRIIVKDLRGGKELWQVLQAADGRPAPGQRLRFFGFDVGFETRGGVRRRVLEHGGFSAVTDGNGAVVVDLAKAFPSRTEGRRWLGGCFCSGLDSHGDPMLMGMPHGSSLGRPERPQSELEHRRGILITDRPLYRPGQEVRLKVWLRNATWKTGAVRRCGDVAVRIAARDPEGREVWSGSGRTDRFGGWDGAFALPQDARLGRYGVVLDEKPQELPLGSFSVEEYRKPEYEVRIGIPEKPPLLGERIPVTIRAEYYFGGPVRAGLAEVRILRRGCRPWRPEGPWNWLYGDGDDRMEGDFSWHPQGRRPGSDGGRHSFLPPGGCPPPEVVLDRKQPLDEQGALTLWLDTAPARELPGEPGHRYEIAVSVRDGSRRTVSARRSLLVCRERFQLAAWTERAFYRAGETISARARAITGEGSPVQVKGLLRIFRIVCDGRTRAVRERPAGRHRVESDADGRLEHGVKLKEAGQYRLEWECAAEGATVRASSFVDVYGDPGAERDFRYAGLELLADKAEYRPGETVRLRINSDAPGSFVLLFIRSLGGLADPPVHLRLLGKSLEYPIPVRREDQPNFFVEAGTMRNGRWLWASREIRVPPASRRLNLEVLPAEANPKPGSESRLRVRVTDAQDRPFRGAVVVAVHDKSLEAVAGGGNVPEIFPFFWKWRNHHRSSFGHGLWNAWDLMFEGDPERMRPLGCWERRPPPGAGDLLLKSAAAPMNGPAAVRFGLDAAAAPEAAGEGGLPDGPEFVPAVRRDFADTACWRGDLVADGRGVVEIPVRFPDSLATWRIQAWAMGEKAECGQGEAEVVASRDLMVRLAAPRFLTEDDRVLLRAVVHNRKDRPQDLEVEMTLLDDRLAFDQDESPVRRASVPAGGERSFEWKAQAGRPGTARVRVAALAAGDGDALEAAVPVREHGFAKRLAFSGMLSPGRRSQKCGFTLPEDYRRESAALEIAWTPDLAAAAAEAAPWLMQRPAGSTEGVLNGFLPAALLDRTLRSRGLSLERIAAEHASSASSSAEPGGRASGGRPAWGKPSEYSERALAALAGRRLGTLAEMQCADGGWGWFRGYGERSSAYLTALMVHGLRLATRAGLAPPGFPPLRRGIGWLRDYQESEYRKVAAPRDGRHESRDPDDLDALVHWTLAENGRRHDGFAARLFACRKDLSHCAVACLALAETAAPGGSEMLPELMRNLRQFLAADAENQTAWLELPPDNPWWRWYGDDLETQALYLQLLARTGQAGSPEAAGLVKYLLNHRRNGTFWRSSKDTARVVEALCEYLRQTPGAHQAPAVTISLDGRTIAGTGAGAGSRVVVPAGELAPGRHEFVVARAGGGGEPLFFEGSMDYFSREGRIGAAGLEIRIGRRICRIREGQEPRPVPDARGQVQARPAERCVREPLAEDAEVAAGDLLEVELALDSKNDYEFLRVEDFKAAGLEPVDQRSGYTGNALGAYLEFRDDRVVMHVPRLPRGRSSIRYRLRAETSGRFSALPARVRGVYAPELQGSSDEWKVRVVDPCKEETR